jgi:hypothetical protein
MPDSNVMNSRRFTDHLVGADQGFVSVQFLSATFSSAGVSIPAS